MAEHGMLVEWPAAEAPLASTEPLIDVHAHFLHAGCGRSDWSDVNRARLRAGERMGITCHVASILGSWGHGSPVYFPSPRDVEAGNDAMLDLQRTYERQVRGYAVVNPNFAKHALGEIERRVAAGAVGIKLLASRRADDPLLDDIARAAAERQLPVLHHAWQHRTRYWPQQDASDATDIVRLAERHPRVRIILAHIGGGGDYQHTFHTVRDQANVYLDISGSGTDRGMLDAALEAVGPKRLLWGCDVTMETGLAKLRALTVMGMTPDEMSDIRWRNAARIFPDGTFPGIEQAKVSQ
ncbi:MAG TPA: amidohydrolase family protein [Gemmatimonadales bacterium]|nr:amidohydrolase family protein [Gemmatimonadales bacterium]